MKNEMLEYWKLQLAVQKNLSSMYENGIIIINKIIKMQKTVLDPEIKEMLGDLEPNKLAIKEQKESLNKCKIEIKLINTVIKSYQTPLLNNNDISKN